MATDPQASASTDALDRIDHALARIEAAAAARLTRDAALDRRHAALRVRVADGIAALDAVIANDAGHD